MDQGNVDFVLLDYSSEDGLAEWVNENLNAHLVSGKLSYYRFDGAPSFHRTHSRNLAFKVAPGEVVCNVDADNFTGTGFAGFIAEQFSSTADIFLTTIDFHRSKPGGSQVQGDVLGRLCVRKKDYMDVGGFDEGMKNYGFEDYDITNRLEMAGLKRELITADKFLKHIPHSSDQRYSAMAFNVTVSSIYINYIDPSCSMILILFNDHTLSTVTMTNNIRINSHDPIYAYRDREYHFENSFGDNRWNTGTWDTNGPIVQLRSSCSEIGLHEYQQHQLRDAAGNIFHKITDPDMLDGVARLYLLSGNRCLMEENLQKKNIMVNNGGFGRGRLIKNFEDAVEI